MTAGLLQNRGKKRKLFACRVHYESKIPIICVCVCLSCLFIRPNRIFPLPLSYLRTQLFPLNDPSAAAKALCRDHQRRSLQEAEEANAKERGGPEREARCREPEEGPDSGHQVSSSLCLDRDRFVCSVIPTDFAG